MMLSSDDEIAADDENTSNKVAGTVETKVIEIKEKGMNRGSLMTLESKLMGTFITINFPRKERLCRKST